MARYIDEDKLCKGLKEMASVQLPDKQSTILGVVSTIENMPAADVVPKSELSIIGVQNMALENTNVDLKRRLVIAEAAASVAIGKASDMVSESKREVAREIFAEIQKMVNRYWLDNDYGMPDMETELSKLKKKYTEDQNDDH